MSSITRRIGVVIFLFAAPSLFAWGRDGHQIVATIAAHGLSKTAADQVALLLGGKSLADVAPLPDDWRYTTELGTADWHYVDIPKSDTAYKATRDCKPPKPPKQSTEVDGDCAVAAIEHFKIVLADQTQSNEVRGRALTFIVHFIGDIHQPLHDADNNDLGGNKVIVTWFGEATHTYPGESPVPWNLHAVWDDAMIARTGMSVNAYADHLLARTQPANATKGTTVDWVNAGYKLAKKKSYVIPKVKPGEPVPLDEAYYSKNLPTVDSQLLLAGLRLRSVIEKALGGTPHASKTAPDHVNAGR